MRFVYRFIPVLALLFTLGANSFAQSASRTVIQVPFDFIAGEQRLPAGTYTVEPVRRDTYTAWEIRSTTGGAGTAVLTSPLRGGATHDAVRLVFRKYGETYLLAQLWPSGDGAGRELLHPGGRAGAVIEALAGKDRHVEAVIVAAR
jgi:hypothetical protein